MTTKAEFHTGNHDPFNHDDVLRLFPNVDEVSIITRPLSEDDSRYAGLGISAHNSQETPALSLDPIIGGVTSLSISVLDNRCLGGLPGSPDAIKVEQLQMMLQQLHLPRVQRLRLQFDSPLSFVDWPIAVHAPGSTSFPALEELSVECPVLIGLSHEVNICVSLHAIFETIAYRPSVLPHTGRSGSYFMPTQFRPQYQQDRCANRGDNSGGSDQKRVLATRRWSRGQCEPFAWRLTLSARGGQSAYRANTTTPGLARILGRRPFGSARLFRLPHRFRLLALLLSGNSCRFICQWKERHSYCASVRRTTRGAFCLSQRCEHGGELQFGLCGRYAGSFLLGIRIWPLTIVTKHVDLSYWMYSLFGLQSFGYIVH